jgi:hypothetical protein
VLEIRPAAVAFLIFFVREPLLPMGVVHCVVDEDARFAHGGAGLLGRVLAGLVEVHAIEAGLARQAQPLGRREFPAFAFLMTTTDRTLWMVGSLAQHELSPRPRTCVKSDTGILPVGFGGIGIPRKLMPMIQGLEAHATLSRVFIHALSDFHPRFRGKAGMRARGLAI